MTSDADYSEEGVVDTDAGTDGRRDSPKLKDLKARAQLTPATVRIGHDGVSIGVVAELNAALDRHELVKVKFMARKDEKKILSRVLEQQTNSQMVQRVGHTATYYRARPTAPPEEAARQG